MTLTAFFLILFSVFLHVSWNLLSKANRPSAAFYFITSVVAAGAAIPCLIAAGINWKGFPLSFWLCFAAASGANIAYYIGLFLSYRRSDISLAYPLVRALPVLFITALTALFGIGKTPTLPEMTGMGIVFLGCLLMPLEKWSDFRLRSYWTPALGTIFLAACGTTVYTIFDSLCIPQLQSHAARPGLLVCGAYMALMEGIIALGLLPVLWLREERGNLRALLRSPAPYLSGIFTLGAYMLVLLAMPMVTNVSFVQAFRQMGLPLGVAAGAVLLKERCSPMRIIGICTIVLGLIILVC